MMHLEELDLRTQEASTEGGALTLQGNQSVGCEGTAPPSPICPGGTRQIAEVELSTNLGVRGFPGEQETSSSEGQFACVVSLV